MNIKRLQTDQELSTVGFPFLKGVSRSDEYINILPLRLIGGIRRGDYTDFFASMIYRGQEPVLLAVMTPPHNLTLSNGDINAIPVLIDYLDQNNISVPGVNGPEHMTAAFTKEWNDRHTAHMTPAITLPFYVLERVVSPARAPRGMMRTATLDDLDTIVLWRKEFAIEAGLPEHEQTRPIEKTIARIKEGRWLVWNDPSGNIVSLAGYAPVTDAGSTIGPVYTPPEHRGHGYASSCVASIAQNLLDQGKWCCLFADAKNPISNAIYQRIGFEHQCTYQEYRLAQ